GSLYDYYTRHDLSDDNANAQASPSPHAQPTPVPTPPPGPAVKTAGGRVFYGGGGITPDVEVKPLNASPLRGRIAEAAFQFTRQLVAGQMPGLEAYKIEKTEYGHVLRSTDYPVTDKVLEAFRAYLRKDPTLGVQPAQVDEELDFVRLRVRDEIITAAYSTDAGSRVLLESDPQVLRAIELLPDAKRLAESIRNGATLS
ncbi:MAG TPA: hypothetical protein VEQ40_11410, partial [Pyrinomonadaceae bacterium]|nr:hypothetical protein [Pyrinomonadaceae bacterium]